MGVDLGRLLVVRPPRKDLGRVAVKLAQARAFDVIVLDYSTPALVEPASPAGSRSLSAGRTGRLRSEVLVRKLALLAEDGGSTILLLTDTTDPRPVPWPVALRLELSRAPGTLTVKVAKERFCRLGSARIAWPAPALA
jgi:recombination protein RecA